jgi:hypothetical protein
LKWYYGTSKNYVALPYGNKFDPLDREIKYTVYVHC